MLRQGLLIERQVPEFGSYLADRLDDLYADFKASRSSNC